MAPQAGSEGLSSCLAGGGKSSGSSPSVSRVLHSLWLPPVQFMALSRDSASPARLSSLVSSGDPNSPRSPFFESLPCPGHCVKWVLSVYNSPALGGPHIQSVLQRADGGAPGGLERESQRGSKPKPICFHHPCSFPRSLAAFTHCSLLCSTL